LKKTIKNRLSIFFAGGFRFFAVADAEQGLAGASWSRVLPVLGIGEVIDLKRPYWD
jgi:hypothetical protein